MRVFSGIRPSGQLHIGNYLGAIQQWIRLQENNECFFCIADLHAITTPYNPKNLKKQVNDTAVIYLASGLEPEKCLLFVQSQIQEHSELAWLLGTITPIGDLQRMTQYKEKARTHKNYLNAGLLNYPILMAADILLYKAELVPVGQDQKQHVELAREIARRFNKKFGFVFPEPKLLVAKEGSKIMSLKNPSKKMSASDVAESYIALTDTPADIKKKIMAAVTDSGRIIAYQPTKKPGLSNLLLLYSLLSQMSLSKVEAKFKGKGYVDFKKALSHLLIKKLEPFRQKEKELSQRKTYVKEILEQGREKAQRIARETIIEVKQKMGLI